MNDTWTDRHVEVDGVETHYIEAGDGDPVGLVHGGGMASCGAVNYTDLVRRLLVINSLNGRMPIPPVPEGFQYIYHEEYPQAWTDVVRRFSKAPADA